MAKSNETYSKKENEKKRLKKQQEKKEKAEARKSGSAKGKSLEDMMAYVDENGNITSTPPDITKQRQVLTENIQIATPKQVPEPEGALKTGVISFFNSSKGYGFIRDQKTQENYFFHINNLAYPAKENDRVNFAIEKGPKGMNAIGIMKVAKA